ncbi:hypothetical protein C8Q78DRAFT_1074188 [Trametes maxima]|nr:hypothetical protein C8Q78DRAFT_1074188 [Trametes maxima]
MSNNTAASNNAGKGSAPPTPVDGSDAKSVMSDTSTLAEGKSASTSTTPKGQSSSTTRTSKKDDSKLDSATAFAKQAANKGWAAPTATRPSFG